MNPATQRELEIFCDALEVSAGRPRHEFLDQTCLGNPRLRGRIEFLLATQPAVDRFFDEIAGTFEPVHSATDFVDQPDTGEPVPNPQKTSRA